MKLETDFLAGLRFGFGRRLPLVLQTEAAECGLACLTMVSKFYGHDVDLAGLRRRFSVSLKGANLRRLISIAGEMKLDSRPLRLEIENLPQLRLPYILHWDLDHFVVLQHVGARGVTIYDPANGVRQVNFDEVSKSFTGVALELTPGVDFKPLEEKRAASLRALTGTIHGVGGAFAQVIMLALALEVFGIVSPFFMQWITDQVLIANDKSLLTILGIGFLLVSIITAVLTAVRSWVVVYISTLLNVQWAGNVFAHMMRLPLAYFEKRHIGDVVSRYNSVGSIQSTLTTKLVGALIDGLMSVATIIVIGIYSIKLTLIVIALFALYTAVRIVAFPPLKQASEDQIVFAARQQSQLLESIRGVQAVKLFNLQELWTARYGSAMVETANRNVHVQRLSIVFSLVQQLLAGGGRIIIVWMAALAVINGQFTIGMLIAFSTYATQFMSRADGLIDAYISLKMLKLYAERLGDIVLTPPERQFEAFYEGPDPEPELELINISFRYADGEPWILRHCSMRIKAGEALAIIGPSGGGKTTLAKIILGLLEPTEGTIKFGGIDIRQLGLRTYREQITAVMQDDSLFAGSIADNISLFRPEANSSEIEEAARLAGIHADIAAMPMGYRSLVGDMGSSLSGGQRQRVVLARALFHRPRLLLLDEATSHLDVARERQIAQAIAGLEMTRIIIAHRPETIASVNQVYLLSNGQTQLLEQDVIFAPVSGDTEAKTVNLGT